MGTLQVVLVLASAVSVPPRESRVDELFRPVADGRMPGAVVAVIHHSKPLLLKGYGMADVEKGVLNSPATIFRIGSVTKSFTSIAVLQLVESGKLKLRDPLSKYLPEFPNGARIRISQLLNHTAGVPDFISYGEMQRRPLEFEPGSRINYSNSGYQLLGKVIEKVSGQPWDEYLRDHVFAPAGMKRTGYDKTEELAGRATGYLMGKDGSYAPVAAQDARGAAAAGGLYSTAEDLVRWEQALAAGKLLGKETLEMATSPGVLSDGRKTRYGMGWMTSTYRGLRETGHGGDITGFNAYFARFPEEKFTVVVLSNTGMRPPGPLHDGGTLAHRIAEIWLGDRMQKPEARADIRVDTGILDTYTGRYKLDVSEEVARNMGTHIVIKRDGQRLIAEANGMAVSVDAKSETVFQAQGSPVELTFVPAATGKSPKIIVSLMGLREFEALRVDE